MVASFALAALLALFQSAKSPTGTRAPPPADPRVQDAVVFVKDLCGDGEGAPPAKNLGKVVVLTDLAKDDPWYALVTRLAAAKKATVVDFPVGAVEKCKPALLRELPEFALVVTKPDHLDVNFHFALLETCAALDADPFLDVCIGYVTGATLDEAKAFVERILALESKKDALPLELYDFGPIAKPPAQFGGPQSDPLAKGWKRWFAYHGSVAEMVAKKAELAHRGILHAGGHGMPSGVDDGLQGADLRREKVDLGAALYFSGPCYCGVTSGWFQPGANGIERKVVKPEESFALAAIARGVSALFAGFDPDRGETCSQEIEHLFVHGDALGHASKESYDGVVVARRQEKLALYRYEAGKPAPQKDLVDTMTGGGACRALFGDPTWAPVRKCAEPLFDVEKKDGPKSLELVWNAEKVDAQSHWSAIDVYHCEGGWTHRLAFDVEVPLATAKALKKFEVKELTAQKRPLEFHFATAMVERFGGKAIVHVYLVFPPRAQQNVFYVEHDFHAVFAFAK
jgi:hypothetical protein